MPTFPIDRSAPIYDATVTAMLGATSATIGAGPAPESPAGTISVGRARGIAPYESVLILGPTAHRRLDSAQILPCGITSGDADCGEVRAARTHSGAWCPICFPGGAA
jgi:hypothetical protein